MRHTIAVYTVAKIESHRQISRYQSEAYQKCATSRSYGVYGFISRSVDEFEYVLDTPVIFLR